MNVDGYDLINVRNSIHRQILNCQVEDWAIDDAIYMIGEALRRGVISTEVYLKRVRNFSRKQFYARALMDKCTEVSGLNDNLTEYTQNQTKTDDAKNTATTRN